MLNESEEAAIKEGKEVLTVSKDGRGNIGKSKECLVSNKGSVLHNGRK